MRIAVDARELTGRVTGVGRYVSRLLEQWRRVSIRHELVLYAHRAIEPAAAAGFPVRVFPGTGGTLWEQLTLSRAIERDQPDVLFCPAYTAPLATRVPVVVTIHDVSFVAHPEWFRRREGLRRRFLTRRAAKHARCVLTVSEFSKREIVHWLAVDPHNVKVILHGVDTPAANTSLEDPHSRVLYVGSIFNRRHVPDLIAAIRRLAASQPTLALDLVGDNRSYPPIDLPALLDQPAMPGHIRWHQYVSDADLEDLYRRARAFAFLSEYEGFGLTPLEAMARGVPPILFDTPVSRESCGDAALYVPIGDISAIVEGLRAVLLDTEARARLLMAAPTVLARYDWATTARQTLAVLEEAS